MIKKRFAKCVSVLVCIAMVSATFSGCGESKPVNEIPDNNEQELTGDVFEETIISELPEEDTNAENTKEETVYIFTDASGVKNNVLVNEKLKNPQQIESIIDVTELQNIINISGDEEFVQNGDEFEWKLGGNSVTYQGTTEKKPPVDIKVTYSMDGVEMTPEEIAGKSGKVTIRLDYENNAQTIVNVKGKEKNVYVPFTVVTGVLLPADKFVNMNVTNGKITESGTEDIVIGMAMPGLNESLKEELGEINLDVDFPDYVEITADTVDFEISMMVSVVKADLLSELSFEEINLDEITGSVDTLKISADTLAEGSGELQQGTQKLADSIPELKSGIEALNNGAGNLASGAVALKDGANTLKAGVDAYADGVSKLSSGAGELNTGANNLKNGISTLSSSVDTRIVDNLSALAAGAASVSDGVNTLANTVGQMANQIDAAKADTVDNVNRQLAANESLTALTGTTVTVENIGTVIEALKTLQSQALTAATLDDSSAAYMAVETNIRSNYPDLSDEQIALQTQATIADLAANAPESIVAYANAYRQGVIANYNSLQNVVLTLTGIQNRVSGAGEAFDGVKAKLTAQDENGQTTGDKLTQLVNGASQVSTGINALKTGVGTFDENEIKASIDSGNLTVCAALYQLKNGSTSLAAGTGSLKGGLDTLSGKSGDLKGGVATLCGGTVTLADGAVKLAGGTNELNDAANTLSEGVIELNSGAVSLKDGMVRFNEEGILQITKLVGEDAVGFVDVFEALIEAGKDYQSFAGKTDDMKGTVTFIYRMEGISR